LRTDVSAGVAPETQSNNEPAPEPFVLSTRAAVALILGLSIFAVAPLLYPGYIQTHSGFVPLWNLADLRVNLFDLGWTPHILTHFDPLRSGGLLPYYLAALLPLGPASAVKLVLGLGWLLGGLGIFLWLKSWLEPPGALVAALVYIYMPHQLVTVYVRGAWAETLFWGLLPWAILTATYLTTSPRWGLLPAAALFWLALGVSHLGLTLWAVLFLALLLLVVHRPQAFLPLLAALLGTAAALIFYLLHPAHTLLGPALIHFADHFLYPFQLFSAYWGFGASRAGWNDGLSLQLGLAPVGLAGLAIYLWQRSAQRGDARLRFFGGAALVLVLLQFGVTRALWDLPLGAGQTVASSLAYPWQLLGLAGLCLSVLAGAAFWLERQLVRLPLLGAVIIIIILSVYSYLLPQFIQPKAGYLSPPPAELGQAQLALLNYQFAVLTSGHTAGLERGETTVPLAVYGPLQADDLLMVGVTWQPLRIFEQDLKVFVHLVDPNDNILAQFDGQPQAGKYSTSRWIPGELVEDTYPLIFPADAPPGPYRLFVGLYDEATLERLPVSTDVAGRVILDVQ